MNVLIDTNVVLNALAKHPPSIDQSVAALTGAPDCRPEKFGIYQVGGKQKYPARSTLRSRRQWWDLGASHQAHISTKAVDAFSGRSGFTPPGQIPVCFRTLPPQLTGSNWKDTKTSIPQGSRGPFDR